jgi:hypothetical protein
VLQNRSGLHILRGEDYTTEVEFIDGCTAFTTGMVRNATWNFGLDVTKAITHNVDIHVMDDLPCDFILDKWLLCDNDAFSEHENLFVDAIPSHLFAQDRMYLITKKKHYKVFDRIRSLFSGSRTDDQTHGMMPQVQQL